MSNSPDISGFAPGYIPFSERYGDRTRPSVPKYEQLIIPNFAVKRTVEISPLEEHETSEDA